MPKAETYYYDVWQREDGPDCSDRVGDVPDALSAAKKFAIAHHETGHATELDWDLLVRSSKGHVIGVVLKTTEVVTAKVVSSTRGRS